jgi:alpha-1,2-mannosyltransferase
VRPAGHHTIPGIAAPATDPLAPAAAAGGDGRLLAAGVTALAAALALYAADVAAHPAGIMLSWFDLRVYVHGGLLARHFPAHLYSWQMVPGIRFTYTPFAAMLFATVCWLPWTWLAWAWLAASIAALVLTVWLVFGELGWRGGRRAGAALAVSAVALWSEPVQRALHLGQVELLLMALVAADLCAGRGRWWHGAGIGFAAGVKLVPLIFIPYLLLTRRVRAAAVASASFAATAAAGFLVLPQPSWQWWVRLIFLDPGRTGRVAMTENQSLLALAARTTGSVAAAGGVWLPVAAVTGVAGLLTAARLHRCGRPVAGWLTCALTGLLVSPVSWDHHWVWLAPGLALLAGLASTGGDSAPRWPWWALAGALAVIFGGWPGIWEPGAGLVPAGLIWYAPDDWLPAGAGAEYHWHGAVWVAGNLYLLTGLALLAGLVVAAARCRASVRQPPAPAQGANLETRSVATPGPDLPGASASTG